MKTYTLDEILAMIQERPKAPVVPPAPAYEGPRRAGDEFNAVHRIDEVLTLLGFHSPVQDRQGTHWTRPGKEANAGSSATVFADDTAKVTIFSSSCQEWWPALEVNKPYDAFGLLVATKYDGDFRRAADDLRTEGYGDEFEDQDTGPSLIDELQAYLAETAEKLDQSTGQVGQSNGWDEMNLTDAVWSTPPPAPDLFKRSDDVCLLYRRRIHYMFGPPESGKSWGAQVASVWAVNADEDVVYLEFENDGWSIRERLMALGIDYAKFGSRFHYFNPSGTYTEAQWATFRKVLDTTKLVVVDGVSNAMSLLGASPLNHDDTVRFEMSFLRPLTAHGAAVVAIDHAPKNTEGATSSVFGAQHKKAAVTGAMFRFEVVKPFGRGLRGVARLMLDKDKPGFLRQHTVDGAVAELVLTSRSDGTVDAQLEPAPAKGVERPTGIMEQLSRYVEQNPNVTGSDLRTQGTSSQAKGAVNRAIECLLQEGYIGRDGGNRFYSKKPFRDGNRSRLTQAETAGRMSVAERPSNDNPRASTEGKPR